MIGPDVPANLRPATRRSVTPFEDGGEEAKAGPSTPGIGPAIPPEILNRSSVPSSHPQGYGEEEGEDEDDYMPALPPDLLPQASKSAASQARSKPIVGPALPPSAASSRYHYEDEDDDNDVGPQPLPAGVVLEQSDGVREFLEKEERRRKQIEEASKPKALKREEWMLVPPSSSDLLGSIDPTKLNKPRQFARTAAPSRDVDNSLWTETPAERQQRLADEVSGKKRRKVNADPDLGNEEEEAEKAKRRKRDDDVRRGVEEYTKKNRGGTLIDQYASKGSKDKKKDGEKDEGPPVIWDHGRDMALSGRLMDDKSRDKMIKDARGLGDRFGTGKSGGFL